jgi:hypothetical protein
VLTCTTIHVSAFVGRMEFSMFIARGLLASNNPGVLRMLAHRLGIGGVA